MFHKFAAAIALVSLSLILPSAQAQLYKWVDASGKTHYSSSPAEAGQASVKEMPVDKAPSPVPAAEVPAWKKQEAAFKRRQAERDFDARNAEMQAQFAQARKAPVRGGGDSPCSLAQNILSGAARHTNGKVTDAHDREVATNDVARYCH
jgi:hypothetical protein